MYTDYKPKHKKQTNGIPMYSERGQSAGFVIGNDWRKDIINAWMLRTPPALAVDVVTLKAAINAGAEWLVIHNTESRITYRASIEKFLSKGWEFNRGFGLQRGMTLNYFQQWRDGDAIPPLTPPTEETAPDEAKELKYTSRAATGITVNGVKQMSLFGEVRNDHYR